jgi:uncharacterized membrane protein
MFSPLYKLLLLSTLLLALAGIVALWPSPAASYPNVMGYSSVCTFAPAASLFCFLLAGTVCFLRASLVKEREGKAAMRLKKHAKALLPLAIVLALALGATAWYAAVKAPYLDPDSGTAASFEE